VVGDGQARIQRRVLGHEGDVGEPVAGPLPEHRDPSGGRAEQAADQAEEGRLAGAVRSDQPDDPPGRNVQGALGEGDAAAVPHAQAFGFDNWRCHGDRSSRAAVTGRSVPL
jgi:hypothetical protein